MKPLFFTALLLLFFTHCTNDPQVLFADATATKILRHAGADKASDRATETKAADIVGHNTQCGPVSGAENWLSPQLKIIVSRGNSGE